MCARGRLPSHEMRHLSKALYPTLCLATHLMSLEAGRDLPQPVTSGGRRCVYGCTCTGPLELHIAERRTSSERAPDSPPEELVQSPEGNGDGAANEQPAAPAHVEAFAGYPEVCVCRGVCTLVGVRVTSARLHANVLD